MVIQQAREELRQFEIADRYGASDSQTGTPPDPFVSDGTAPSVLRLDLLGPPQVSLGGRTLVLRTRKSLALLVYLAIERYQHPREHLVELLWPDVDLEDGRASLRTALSYLRQPLGAEADSVLLASREYVSLRASAPLDLDVRALDEAQKLIRQTQHIGTSCPAGVRSQIASAAERYGGPFLSGISIPDAPDFEAWMERQRTYWRSVEEELLDRQATLQLQAGDMGAAITTLERWTAVNPDEDVAWQRLMQLHLRAADVAAARRVWKAYREMLAELDVEPSEEMTALATRVDELGDAYRLPVALTSAARPDSDPLSMPFVGRSHELSLLRAAYERVQAGRTEVIILEGEAGSGKTRLISQFLQAVHSVGADVMAGYAVETVDELPYASLVQALRKRLEEENAPDDLLGDLWLAELSQLLPELRERYPDLPVPMEDPSFRRGRLFEAVVRLGMALAERAPLVLSLDDFQWTGGATKDLVRYAVHRWSESGAPVLVILTLRSENLGTDRELNQWLGGLERDAPTHRMEVGTLSPGDVVQIAGILTGYPVPDSHDDVPDKQRLGKVVEFGEWLARRTEGRPIYVTEALHGLLEDGLLRVRPAGDRGWLIDVPDSIGTEFDERLRAFLLSRVQMRIAERLNRLGEVEENVLMAAAVLNGRITRPHVLRVASVDEDAAFRALDTLVQEGLLQETGEDDGYDFPHILMPDAVYAVAGKAKQRLYQHRALATLGQGSPSRAELARQAVAV